MSEVGQGYRCGQCGRMNPAESKFCNGCGYSLHGLMTSNGFLVRGTLFRGTYEIGEVLGEGGMGVVYSCRHRTLGTQYAMKVLDAKLARLSILRERFLAEARIQATITHPHIVRVMDVLDSDGVLAIVMEYVDGEALDEYMSKHGGKLSIKAACGVALVLLDAIGYAHQSGVIHRDLKPSNVMLSKGFSGDEICRGVKIMDFGIAKVLDSAESRTVTGAKMGTPRYMAPEQVENAREVDARTDIYAIGLTLYEMLCGRTPFEEYREFELMKAQLSMLPPSMKKFRPEIPEKLESIVMKALKKRREDRYPDAASFQQSLLQLGLFDHLGMELKPESSFKVDHSSAVLQRKIERALDKRKNISSTSKAVLARVGESKKSVLLRADEDLSFDVTQDDVEVGKSVKSVVGRDEVVESLVVEREDSLGESLNFDTGGGIGDKERQVVKKKLSGRAKAYRIGLLLLVILLLVGVLYRHFHKVKPSEVVVKDETMGDGAEKSKVVGGKFEVEVMEDKHGAMTKIISGNHWVSTLAGSKVALKAMKLNAFWIDQVAVSQYRYMQCVEAGGCSPIVASGESLNLPVRGIGYGSAEAYCKWAGKRLATEAEWEAAARFGGDSDGISFVDVDCEHVHFDSGEKGECKGKKSAPESVFSRVSGANPGHLLQMLGNVWEWTSDEGKSKQERIVKGGSYLSPRAQVRVSSKRSVGINSGGVDVGFRCVKDVK